MPFLVSVAFLWAAGAPAPAAAVSSPHASVSQFITVIHAGASAWLLEENEHTVYVQSGMSAPKKQTVLHLPFGVPQGRRPPRSIAGYRGQWIISDGSSFLSAYATDGSYVRGIPVPIPAFDLFVSGDRLYVYDALPDLVKDRLYFTNDLKRFSAAPLNAVDLRLPERSRLLAVQLLFAPTGDGGYVFIHGIGAPLATIVTTLGGQTSVPLAYARTQARARLISASQETDLHRYSAPARDALWTNEGELYVLRNREDVRAPGGSAIERGRRIDRYDRSGHLLATAALPAEARWILRADPHTVVVLMTEGGVATASFGSPQPGRLID